MTLKPTVRSLAVAAAFATSAAGAFAADTPATGAGPREAGVWYDDTGKGAVKIDVCGGKLCGKIYWLKDKLNAEGKPLIDRHNPNEAQRTRPICGLQVIGGLAAMDDGTWDTGWIYDPKEGKSYSVAISMTAPDTLKVTGYLMMKMMGRTLTWKKAPGDLPACDQTAAATPPAPAGAATAPAQKKASAAGAAAAGAAGAASGTSGKTGEALPWANKKAPAGGAPAAGASKLGGDKLNGGKPAAAKAVKKPASTTPAAKAPTQQPLEEFEAR